MKMDYAKSIYITNKEDMKILSSNKELLNNGYVCIKFNNETKKIVILESVNTIEKKEKLYKKDYNRKMSIMIENWNNFRDKDIELRGDLSLYFNYKKEIEKIINEDKEMEELIKERSNDNKEYDYSSDEENNKFLLY
tara:strand:- start:51 stop:461 length:411 start_codon:yes stop_codon:yes gene_type:complete